MDHHCNGWLSHEFTANKHPTPIYVEVKKAGLKRSKINSACTTYTVALLDIKVHTCTECLEVQGAEF